MSSKYWQFSKNKLVSIVLNIICNWPPTLIWKYVVPGTLQNQRYKLKMFALKQYIRRVALISRHSVARYELVGKGSRVTRCARMSAHARTHTCTHCLPIGPRSLDPESSLSYINPRSLAPESYKLVARHSVARYELVGKGSRVTRCPSLHGTVPHFQDFSGVPQIETLSHWQWQAGISVEIPQ